MFKNRNIRVLFAISFLQGLVFYASIATLYRRAAGVSMFQITLMESISLLLSLALEVPWGIAADRIGYRKTSIICNVLFLFSKIVFWQADGFAGFLAERILLAVVAAGFSGVDESIMVASCPEGETHRAFGWSNALGTAGLMCASLVYSLFIGDDYRLAAFLTVISHAAAAAASFFLVETGEPCSREHRSIGKFKSLLHQLIRTRGLLSLVLGGALFGECVQVVTVFLNQLQYERCGWPAAWMGAAHVLATAVMLSSAGSARCARRLGERRMGLIMICAGGVSCIVLAFAGNGWVSLGCIMLLGLVCSLLSPLIEEIKNRLIMTEDRATALSVTALFTNSTAILIELTAGRLADATLSGAMLFCTVLCMAAMALFTRAVKA